LIYNKGDVLSMSRKTIVAWQRYHDEELQVVDKKQSKYKNEGHFHIIG